MKLLIITYYFPPCGGAPVQRWLRFIPLLNEVGYDITVLTTNNGDYPLVDLTLVDKIPPEINVIRANTPRFGKIWESIIGKKSQLPYGSLNRNASSSVLERVLIWLRLNFIIPDARVIWNHNAKRVSRQLCKKNNYDWIITTGPPHSTHLIGMHLKKHFKLKWAADFRDPWTRIFYLKHKPQNIIAKAINKYLERRVLRKADKTLVVSNFIANQLPLGKKVVLYNGYNAVDFNSIVYKTSSTFRIKYIGQLTEGQNILEMLNNLSTIISTRNIKDVSFQFIGTKTEPITTNTYPVEVVDFLSHDEAIYEMVNCELLILIINRYDDNQGMITTKLFEYIASKTPIICIGPENGEAANIIRETQAGNVSDVINNSVSEYFNEIYDCWSAGKPLRNDHDTSQWSVQQQIGALISELS